MRAHRWQRLVVVAASAAVAMALGAPAVAAQRPARVMMKDFAFAPATVTIRVGQTVRWTYDESVTDPTPNCETFVGACPGHSTTSLDRGPNGRPLWDSGVHRAKGFPYSHTFTKPGRYRYICTVHGGANPNNPLTHMDGVVIVRS